MIVIGIEFRKGVYEGKPWNNVHLYCVEDIPVDKGEGQRTKDYKCRPDLAKDVELGDKIKVYFDEYDNVDLIKVL